MALLRNTLVTIFAAIVCFFSFANIASAENISLEVPVQNSEEQPIPNLTGLLSAGTDLYSQSNEQGLLMFFDIEEGSYTLLLLPSQSFECSDCGLLQDIEVEVDVSTESENYDPQTGTLTLDPVTVPQATRYLEITVIEAETGSSSGAATVGDPVPGLFVNGWTEPSGIDDPGNFAGGMTNNDGQFFIALAEDDSSIWNVSTFDESPEGGSFASASEFGIEPNATGVTEVTLEVRRADATINGSLVLNGEPYTLGQEQFGSLNCFVEPDPQDPFPKTDHFFFTDFQPGQNSANLPVLGGNEYHCDVWLEGFGSKAAVVDVGQDQTVSATLELIELDGRINVRVVDQDNNIISGVIVDFFAFAAEDAEGNPLNHFANAFVQNGEVSAQLAVISGVQYEIGYFLQQGDGPFSLGASTKGVVAASDGTRYVQSYEPVSGQAGDTIDFTALEADVTINVTVLEPDGSPSSMAFVGAFQDDVEGDNKIGISVGAPAIEGQAQLFVVSGIKYKVFAYPEGAFEGNVMPPGEQTITPQPGETLNLVFQAQEADFTLSIIANVQTAEATISASELEFGFCYGYTVKQSGSEEAGPQTETFTDLFGGTGNMGLISGLNWFIGCMGNSGNEFFRTLQDVSYTAEGSSGELVVTMVPAGDFFEDQSFTGDTGSTQTFTLPDGESTITVPAGAFGDSGTYTLTIGSVDDPFTVDPSQYPVNTWKLEARDSTGNVISEFSKNVTLRLKINTDFLPEGVSLEDLVAGVYDSNTGAWTPPVSADLDTSDPANPFLFVTINHFSFYGILGNVEEDRAGGGGDNQLAIQKVGKCGERKLRAGERCTLDVQWLNQASGEQVEGNINVQLQRRSGHSASWADVAGATRLIRNGHSTFGFVVNASGLYRVVAVNDSESDPSNEVRVRLSGTGGGGSGGGSGGRSDSDDVADPGETIVVGRYAGFSKVPEGARVTVLSQFEECSTGSVVQFQRKTRSADSWTTFARRRANSRDAATAGYIAEQSYLIRGVCGDEATSPLRVRVAQ